MANLFRNIFKQIEKPQSIHPPSIPQEFSQYEAEYIEYCIDQEQAVSKLETCLHATDDPKEIAMKTLKTACDFYGADWASVVEIDLSLGIWAHGWWHNPDPKITTIQYADEFETLKPMERWIEAMRRNEPIVVPDIKASSVTQEERCVYEKLHAHSVMAFPFGPNPVGFLVLRNPTRYMGRISTMKTLAFVLHRAMAQRNTIEQARMALSPDEIRSEEDIIINFFGGMEITTSAGVWKSREFNAPKSSRAVAYILLQGRSSHSALTIAEALYPEDNSDVDTINKYVRGYIYRFRKSFEPICKHKLIEYTQNGYRINPELNVMTDLQKFEGLWRQVQKDIPIPQKVHALKHAIKLYKGPVLGNSSDNHWLVGIATDYKIKYITMVNELLSILAQFEDYDGVHHFAMNAINLVPENVKAHYWLIHAIFHSGVVALAKQEIRQAKIRLTADEFDTLQKFIGKDKTLPYGQLFDE